MTEFAGNEIKCGWSRQPHTVRRLSSSAPADDPVGRGSAVAFEASAEDWPPAFAGMTAQTAVLRRSPHSARTSGSVSPERTSAFRAARPSGAIHCDSAHTAAPRTTGSRRRAGARPRRQRRVAGVADRDQHVAHEPVAADALDRRSGETARGSAASSSASRSASAGARSSRARRRRASRAACGELVPRADRQAIVAAIDAVADRRAEFLRDRPLMLDGQVGDAAPRIEPVGRGKGIGRAGVEAGAAGAAMVALRRVGRQLERREDRAEEQPGADARG